VRIEFGHRLCRMPSQSAKDRIENLPPHDAVEEVPQRMEVETTPSSFILRAADLPRRLVKCLDNDLVVNWTLSIG
jgi:hypothetical protein